MKPSPIQVSVPSNAEAGSIIASTITMLRAFGWELGERYDEAMRPKAGPDWPEKLRKVRHLQFPDLPLYKKSLNLRDPQFGVNEPLRNDDSPLRSCLPPFTLHFYDAFKRVPELRNREQHFEELPSLGRLRKDAELIASVAGQIGLPMAAQCANVLDAIETLASGGRPKSVHVEGELTTKLAEKQAEAKRLAAEVAVLRALKREQLTTAQDDAQAKADLEAQLEKVELARSLTEELLAETQATVAAQAALARKESEKIGGLAPGEVWPVAPPARTLRLLAHVGDLYDPVAKDLLSNQLGDVAVAAAARWRVWLPHGGVVLVNPAGQGVALVDGAWTFVGALDA
jgi:hypothetical protein